MQPAEILCALSLLNQLRVLPTQSRLAEIEKMKIDETVQKRFILMPINFNMNLDMKLICDE